MNGPAHMREYRLEFRTLAASMGATCDELVHELTRAGAHPDLVRRVRAEEAQARAALLTMARTLGGPS